MEDGVFPNMAPTNVPYLVVSSLVAAWLLFVLLVYRCQYFQSPPIAAILALLLLNSFLELLFQLPAYFQEIPNSVCLVSITGTTFFRLASYYWVIFVTRLVYRQRLEPGKFIDLNKYIGRNVIFTYIPSVVVTLVVIVVASLDDTQSEANCWRRINEKTVTDYIVYLASFVFPNLIALILTLVMVLAYLFIKQKSKTSLALFFPLTALPFMIYYLMLKLMTFFGEWDVNNLLDIPMVGQPLAHGVIFALVLRNLSKGKRPTSSDLTIAQESSFHQSMVPQGQQPL